MTRSELIDRLIIQLNSSVPAAQVETAVKVLLNQMVETLAAGERIEIRGFGSFSIHHRPPRLGRNPRTGESVTVPAKRIPHFKPGKELRERVNQPADQQHAA